MNEKIETIKHDFDKYISRSQIAFVICISQTKFLLFCAEFERDIISTIVHYKRNTIYIEFNEKTSTYKSKKIYMSTFYRQYKQYRYLLYCDILNTKVMLTNMRRFDIDIERTKIQELVNNMNDKSIIFLK